MHVCAIGSARATIGGPSFALRTACRKAPFHRKTTLPPGGTPRALDASLGNASDAAPAPAATRKRRRESSCSRASKRELLGPGEIERRDGEVKTLDEIARLAPRCRRRQRLVQARAPPRGRARAGLAASSSSPLLRTFAAETIYATCADLANLRRKDERGSVGLQKRDEAWLELIGLVDHRAAAATRSVGLRRHEAPPCSASTSETSDIGGCFGRCQCCPVPSSDLSPAHRPRGEVLPRAGRSDPAADPRTVAGRGTSSPLTNSSHARCAAAEGLESSCLPALVRIRRGAT
jgi:hypothetical protein